MGALADPHSPVNRGLFCIRIDARRFPDLLGRHTADLLRPFRCVRLEGFQIIAEAFGPLRDELLVVQFFLHNDMSHRLKNGDIAARVLTEPDRGEIRHLDLAWIDNHEFGAVFTNRPL